MVKRLCKYNRHEIVESLEEIQSLVCSPTFMCSSCARSASQAGKLCKPIAITSLSFQIAVGSAKSNAIEVSNKKRKKQKKAKKKLNKLVKRQEKLAKKALKVKREIAGQEMIIQCQEQHYQSSHCH